MPTIDVEQQRRDARRAYLNFLSLKRSSRQLGDRGNLAVASSAVGWRQWRGAGPVGGDYISRKREFSCLAAGLRLKVRKGHSDESNTLRWREHGTDQVEGDFMHPWLVWIADSIDRLRVDN